MNIEEEGNRIAERVKFHTLCRLFEKLKVSGNAKSRRQILSRFIQLWEDQYAALGSSDTRPASGRASFYPCLRLLMPEFDRARPAYGLRETALSRLYIKAFGIAPNGPVAQSLSHPMYSGKGTDFADILFEAVRDRCREDNLLTLKDANDLLDRLASADNSDERLDAMTQFLRSATAVEQKWMIRIIVRRRSGCGLGVSVILQCLHPAAPGLWNVTQDLSVLCQRIGEIDLLTFTKDQKGSLTPDITLFVPFRPMLCERSNSPESLCQSVISLCSLGSVDLDTVRILLETKYDGERIQIHKSGSAYRYWSRNCLEWTSSYGADGELKQGSLTPRLHEAFRVDVHDCILDAEIMAYNTWTDTVVPKTCGFDVKRSQSADGSMSNWFGGDEAGAYQPCVVVFDVMYLNGKSLTSTPILERKRLLKELFVQHKPTVSEGSLEIADEDEFDYLPEPLLVGAVYLSRWSLVPVKVDQVSKIFNRLVDTRQEGLVAKLTVGISPYLPGRRLHGGWWKLKPDYVEGLLTDLDCLVVGGYYLSVLGRKTRRIGHFICAVRDDRRHGANHSDKANLLPTFLSFCRVSNGLSTSQLKEINLKLRPHWRPYDRKHPNTGLTEWLRVTTERPDVWIAPQHSIIFQVHASEITSSSSYAAGMTLRFPRVTAVREDKPWQDCLTISELSQLNKETEGKMTVQRLSVPGSGVDSDGESDMDSEVSQCSGRSSPERYNDSALGLSTSGDLTDSLSILDDDPLANSTPVKKRKLRRDNQNNWRSSAACTYEQNLTGTGFLSGFELCLLLPPDQRKTDLESRVRAFGGTIVQNPGPDTFCLVTDKLTVKIKNLIGDGLSSNTELPVADAKYNIVRLEWLSCALDRGKFVPWKPDDMWAMTKSTAKTVLSRFDRFGDSFFEPISSDELKVLCTRMASKDRAHPVHSRELTSALLDELKSLNVPILGPLFSCHILVLSGLGSSNDRHTSSTTSLFNRLMLADLRRLGAVVLHFEYTVTPEILPELVLFVAHQLGASNPQSGNYAGPKLSHVLLLQPLVYEEDTLLMNKLREQLRNSALCHPAGPLVVDKMWARQCVDSESRCPETIVDI